MATDCEKLSPNAETIFKKLEQFFPPDPWDNPNWLPEGIVRDNGMFDLRKSVDRNKLEEKTRISIAGFVEVSAGVFLTKNKSLEGFEVAHFGLAIKKQIELIFILRELDFQIETMDLID